MERKYLKKAELGLYYISGHIRDYFIPIDDVCALNSSSWEEEAQ